MRKSAIVVFILVVLSAAVTYKALSYDVRETKQELDGKQLENKKNWTKISSDMPAEQVKNILGEPERVLEGVTTTWFYQKGGSVSLAGGKVIKFVKPFSWDY